MFVEFERSTNIMEIMNDETKLGVNVIYIFRKKKDDIKKID